MTPSEFKHWFEGFTEAMHGLPNSKQWARIQERVKEINDVVTSYPIFVEKYWPARRWNEYTSYYGATWGGSSLDAVGIGLDSAVGKSSLEAYQGIKEHYQGVDKQSWNSADAFKNLGLADFQGAVQ
jgi:hypothetical protein